jgi:hypothetical protein
MGSRECAPLSLSPDNTFEDVTPCVLQVIREVERITSVCPPETISVITFEDVCVCVLPVIREVERITSVCPPELISCHHF